MTYFCDSFMTVSDAEIDIFKDLCVFGVPQNYAEYAFSKSRNPWHLVAENENNADNGRDKYIHVV